DKGDHDGAIADYDRAIELDSKFADAYYDRALAKKAKGDQEGASADFNKAHALNPKLGAAGK
ncbi:MAG TPA: tetratricopeptide repeat protein, partial [Chthoniobacteraceae bacterium]|nr:tetratricopeptide repeat protein [Chthoniobacteraceae bacterium]